MIWLPKVEISLSEDSKEYICPLYNDAINLCGSIIAFNSDQLTISVLKQLHWGIKSALNTFNNFVNNYVGGTLSYFFSILPPIFRNLLVLWFTFLISYYTIHFT